MSLDYYATLKVTATASEAEIKAAYRKLAREYHPDSAGDRGDALKFSDLADAYNTLIDPELRRSYDHSRRRRASSRSQSNQSYSSASYGKSKAGSRGTRQSQQASGRNSRSDAHTKDQQGTTEGNQTRGSTSEGQYDSKDYSGFNRQGLHLYEQIEISAVDALLGCQASIISSQGVCKIKIPPGFESGRTLRVEGQGIAIAGRGEAETRGDLFVTVNVQSFNPAPISALKSWLGKKPKAARK